MNWKLYSSGHRSFKSVFVNEATDQMMRVDFVHFPTHVTTGKMESAILACLNGEEAPKAKESDKDWVRRAAAKIVKDLPLHAGTKFQWTNEIERDILYHCPDVLRPDRGPSEEDWKKGYAAGQKVMEDKLNDARDRLYAERIARLVARRALEDILRNLTGIVPQA